MGTAQAVSILEANEKSVTKRADSVHPPKSCVRRAHPGRRVKAFNTDGYAGSPATL